jgi:hypothetical protein
MKYTIEELEIKSKREKRLVVWHGEAGKICREAYPPPQDSWSNELEGGVYILFSWAMNTGEYNHIATALPPLPRKPKPEQLYEYASKGLFLHGEVIFDGGIFNVDFATLVMRTIKQSGYRATHALDREGNRVELVFMEEV